MSPFSVASNFNVLLRAVHADKSWKDKEKHNKNVHFDFLKILKEKHQNTSPQELDLSTYLQMNMSTKEISKIITFQVVPQNSHVIDLERREYHRIYNEYLAKLLCHTKKSRWHFSLANDNSL